MISKEKAFKLIAIYFFISELYEKELKYLCERHSNNAKPKFTDIEVLSIYIFVASEQHYKQIKEIYSFTKDFLFSWFPKLPTYQQFDVRLNKLLSAFEHLQRTLLTTFIPDDCDFDKSLVDSFPVVTCKGRNRQGKVAREIANKGFCSTKNMHYYGLKLHSLAYRRKGTIPFPEMLALSPASENDYKVFVREFDPYLFNRTVFADKSYTDEVFFDNREISQNYQILTPVKLVKGEPESIRQRDKAANDLLSNAVSSVRQPVESLFNWLNEKTNLQNASKVRSTAGLLLHVFAKLCAAFIYLIF